MRTLTNKEKIFDFIKAFARLGRTAARVYFTGGVTAVMKGWRESTVDIDIRFYPETDELFRALPELKERLHVNIELASPLDFIPPVPGWEDRSIFITREGKVDFFHFDLYSQALSKIERGHSQDRTDVEFMFREKLIDPEKLREMFNRIERQLYRYPAINPEKFSAAVDKTIADFRI